LFFENKDILNESKPILSVRLFGSDHIDAYMTILPVIRFLNPSPPPFCVFYSLIGLLTSVPHTSTSIWTLWERDVSSTRDTRCDVKTRRSLSFPNPAYQCCLIAHVFTPVFPSREQNRLVNVTEPSGSCATTANANRSARMMYTAVKPIQAHKGSRDVLPLWYQTGRNLLQITSF